MEKEPEDEAKELPRGSEVEELKASLELEMPELLIEAAKVEEWDLGKAMDFARKAYLKGGEHVAAEIKRVLEGIPSDLAEADAQGRNDGQEQ